MKRRDFLKLAALSPLGCVLPEVSGPKAAAQKSMSPEQMYQQLCAIEGALLLGRPREQWTVFISRRLCESLCEKSHQSDDGPRAKRLFGFPVQVCPFLPYKETNGREVHAVAIQDYNPFPSGVITPWGEPLPGKGYGLLWMPKNKLGFCMTPATA